MTPLPPLVAILRGLRSEEAEAVGEALVAAGFCALEVPLNSPRPVDSIARLADALAGRALVGAGTVLTVADVGRVADAGGQLVVAPNCDPAVIRESKRRGLLAMPGVATPSEAFAALDAGADALKMFPAEQMPPAIVKAWRAVLPAGTRLYPVGGIDAANIAAYRAAGADGFGIGSAVYKPGAAVETVAREARRLVAAFDAAA
jgi:2-dehydro-3-deoxyphosphogalactonate aldolase